MLAQWNEIFTWMPMETVLYQNRPRYYQAIRDAKKTNDSGAFIEFTFLALLETIEAQARQINEQASASVSGDESAGEFVENTDEFVENAGEFVEKFVDSDTQKAILRLLIAQPTISAKKIAAAVGISSRGVQKNIDVLKKRGLVERIGPAKSGHWSVKKPD
jgi:Fic family protein